MKYFCEYLKKEIEFPDSPKRVISLNPSATDCIFKLGIQNLLVGISHYCRYLRKETKCLPSVGSYLEVDWKLLEFLKPEIIFLTTGIQRKLVDILDSKGYKVFILPLPVSIFGILENIRKMGILLNKSERAEKLIASLFKKLENLREKVASLQVYYEVDLGSPITCGGPSHITHGLKWIGLRNIYSSSKHSYFKPSDKETRKRNFEIIIYESKHKLSRSEKKKVIKKLLNRFGDKKVIIFPPNSLSHHGPSFLDSILPRLKIEIKSLFDI